MELSGATEYFLCPSIPGEPAGRPCERTSIQNAGGQDIYKVALVLIASSVKLNCNKFTLNLQTGFKMRKAFSPMKEEIKVPKLGMNTKTRVRDENEVQNSSCSPNFAVFLLK